MKKSSRTSAKTNETMVKKLKEDEGMIEMEIENDDIDSDENEEDDDSEELVDNANGTKKRGTKNLVDSLKAKKYRDASVIYIGHLPALFGEFELLSLLKQFGGTITHVRISRSEKTGNSRGYAFIRILESEIASIIVNTLSGYLLFSQKSIGTHKRFVCHIVPPEKVHPRLFLKHTCAIAVSKARKQQKLLLSKQSKSLSKLSAVNEKLLQQEQKKRMKIKEAGIDYDFPGYEKKSLSPSTTTISSPSTVKGSDSIKKNEPAKASTPTSSVNKRKAIDAGAAKQEVTKKVMTAPSDEKEASSKKKPKDDAKTLITASTPTKKRLHETVPVASLSASKASLSGSSTKTINQGKKKKNRHSK